jgi:putative drug exporter of the RND superfamily
MAHGVDRRESIARAVATLGGAIVFAGRTVIIALLSLWVAGIPLVASLGYASAVAVFTAVLAAVTLLPAMLSLAGRHLFGANLPAFLRPRTRPGAATLWSRWAATVTAHPLVCGLAAPALLVPLIVRCSRCTWARRTSVLRQRSPPSAGPSTSWPRSTGPGTTALC